LPRVYTQKKDIAYRVFTGESDEMQSKER
jgi:hypothetical protein